MKKKTFEAEFKTTNARIEELIILQKNKLKNTKTDNGAARIVENNFAVGPGSPGQITSDTIAALEVLKVTLLKVQEQWIDPASGNFYPIPNWLALVFRPALRKKVIATVEFLQQAVVQIIEIYTTE
jgi:hypothetical protein